MKKIGVVLFLVFGLSLLFASKTYAVDDASFTVTSSSTFPFYICGSGQTYSCSDYTYLKVEPTFALSSPTNASYQSIQGMPAIRVPTYIESYYSLSYSPSNLYLSDLSGSATSIKFTLTNSISSGSCPEPEPQEPCPDPEEESRFIQVVLDAFWRYHKAFAGAAAALIAIFLVYRVIKGRLR